MLEGKNVKLNTLRRRESPFRLSPRRFELRMHIHVSRKGPPANELLYKAIPGMLLAFVLCYDYQRSRDSMSCLVLSSWKGQRYIWYALPGYAVGLIVALATGTLTLTTTSPSFFGAFNTRTHHLHLMDGEGTWTVVDGTGHNPNEKDLEVQV